MPPRKDSKQRLVRAALQLFGQRGYHDTGIADILKESGCTRGVLYYYFSSKEELGYAAMEEETRLLSERGAASHLRSVGHPIDLLVRALDAMPHIADPRAAGARVADVSLRMAAVHEGFRKHLGKSIGPYSEQIEDMIRQGVAEGKIAESVDPRVLAHVIICMGAGIHLGSLAWDQKVIWKDARRWLKDYLISLRK